MVIKFGRVIYMKCLKCNFIYFRVVDLRYVDEVNVIRCRRECENCGMCFIIFEYIEVSLLIVVKKDGIRE